MKGRRVLITGAGGFVGSALSEGFASRGWDVVAIDRSFDADPSRDGTRTRRVVADVADGVPDGIGAVDLVVHAAWVTTAPEDLGVTRAEYSSLNLKPLEAVLRWVARARPAAFVFLSSSGVFAAADAATGSSASARRPDAAAPGLTDALEPTSDSPYAVAKRTGEDLVVTAGTSGRTSMHVVRLGYLYGPGEMARPTRLGVSLVAQWIAAARAGRPLEVRVDDPRREWTWAPDLAPALARIVEGPATPGPIHLCSPHVYGDRELARAVAAAIPGGEVVTVPAMGRVKAPMVPSDLAALRDFEWTAAAEGLRVAVGREVVA
ncbi:MAG: NAD(P)-dependent oxidoreductase [Gemmatimonadetes bacterium]|nr:NAD(P)-dependent oxidoreductase [Gemmatimonadota bacterium]